MEADLDEILRLLAVLRRQFKAANLSYADVAAAIGVSEPMVKRRMAGRDFLCALTPRQALLFLKKKKQKDFLKLGLGRRRRQSPSSRFKKVLAPLFYKKAVS